MLCSLHPTFKRVSCWLQEHLPRLSGWTLITLALLASLSVLHPTQLAVVLYKAALVLLAAVIAYWIDRSLFPYARPHRLSQGLTRDLATLRRALIVIACVLGLTLGL